VGRSHDCPFHSFILDANDKSFVLNPIVSHINCSNCAILASMMRLYRPVVPLLLLNLSTWLRSPIVNLFYWFWSWPLVNTSYCGSIPIAVYYLLAAVHNSGRLPLLVSGGLYPNLSPPLVMPSFSSPFWFRIPTAAHQLSCRNGTQCCIQGSVGTHLSVNR
jgi:hypothetical protein